MAVASFTAKAASSTDALLRDWGSKLSAAIQSVGLVKTADTGQIDWNTVVNGATVRGYEIFRFNDTLNNKRLPNSNIVAYPHQNMNHL